VSARDIGTSVMQRLVNKSRTQSRQFQELLQYFAPAGRTKGPKEADIYGDPLIA